jgi:glutamyl-tRNA reductase
MTAPLQRGADERLTTTVQALQRHHERFRVDELERARRSLAGGMPEEKVLEELARRLTNKFLHGPMHALNQATADESARLTLLLQHIYRPVAE